MAKNIIKFAISLGCWAVFACNNGAKNTKMFIAPPDWINYVCDKGAFTLQVPPTMEYRNPDSAYARSRPYLIREQTIVFQQKGLNKNFLTMHSDSTYARVIITYFLNTEGEFPSIEEPLTFTPSEIYDIVDTDIGQGFDGLLMEITKYGNERINGNNIYTIEYVRKGVNNNPPVNTKIYITSNAHYLVYMSIAYRSIHAEKWKEDLNNIIQTFRWNTGGVS